MNSAVHRIENAVNRRYLLDDASLLSKDTDVTAANLLHLKFSYNTLFVTSFKSCICVLINRFLRKIKSQWSGFSTSAIPHGYILPLNFLPFMSSIVLLPTTANGNWACWIFGVVSQASLRYEEIFVRRCWVLLWTLEPYQERFPETTRFFETNRQ